MNWNSDITEIKGIGEKTAKLFHKLEIYQIRDLLYHFPRNYEKFEAPKRISEIQTGVTASFKVKIPFQNIEQRKQGSLSMIRLIVADDSGRIEVVFYNMPFLKKTLIQGREYILRGKIEEKKGRRIMEQPKLYLLEEYEKYENTLQPVYPLTKGLSINTIQKAVKTVLEHISLEKEVFPDDFREKYDLMDYESAIKSLHFPTLEEDVIKARKRLVFEEFLAFCLQVKKKKQEELSLPFFPPLLRTATTNRLLEQLPYQLTGAQKKAWEELEKDLTAEVAMNRMIQGDVGSGKTILAILSCVLAAANGRQAAFMAPTEVLAKQHYTLMNEMTEEFHLPVKPVLLVGSMTAKEKRRVYEEISSKEANVIIGTHALIQEKVNYKDLALVITDEQHRFGVRQRQMLLEKGKNTHVCVMSATPIPRTLAIVLFGDLSLSVLDEMPVGRLPIKNCVVDPSYREKAYQFIENEIAKGHQIYCICPMVEEGEMEDLENVEDYTIKLKERLGDRIRVDYLHGKMKPSLKNQIMEDFGAHRIDVLVSTTVIEVGINVPNATVMMVENSERFGLAQLHQLRGRVGRGKEQSYCIFVNTGKSEKTKERLELLNRSNDGFFLANEDMRLRGPGDIFGIRQSGEFVFEIGDIYQDSELLFQTADLADTILNSEHPEVIFPAISEFYLRNKNFIDFRSI